MSQETGRSETMRWFCTDCLAGNCVVCVDLGPQLDDGTVCECEHDDLDATA